MIMHITAHMNVGKDEKHKQTNKNTVIHKGAPCGIIKRCRWKRKQSIHCIGIMGGGGGIEIWGKATEKEKRKTIRAI